MRASSGRAADPMTDRVRSDSRLAVIRTSPRESGLARASKGAGDTRSHRAPVRRPQDPEAPSDEHAKGAWAPMSLGVTQRCLLFEAYTFVASFIAEAFVAACCRGIPETVLASFVVRTRSAGLKRRTGVEMASRQVVDPTG